jgi:dihydrofolate reductase
MQLSIIVAVAQNGVIGRGGQLPWHLPGDLRRFKQLTMGHTMIMGRRTWESIGRALPGRQTIVVTRQPNYLSNDPNVTIASGLDDALQAAADAGDDEAFIVGGAELYTESLPLANRLYITHIHANVEGDTYFPDVHWQDWRPVAAEEHDADEKNEHAYRFEVYERF